ncbi:hypothetical protein NQ318_019374 [Aromia moschata]|uniref:Mitochondrial inner membrane protein Mpv17 n=1 Tax=Aromia moschata TaxID=1265417 RepID=A0AAV8XM56_9CUCU|nr:hypothetical protein NQ318_019374 [Aromia moschata]
MNRCNRLFTVYSKLLKKHTLLVQSVQTGFIMGMGDLVAQTVVEKKPLKHVEFFENSPVFYFRNWASGLIMGMGDLTAQTSEKQSLKQLDLLRTSHFFGLGLTLVGPASSRWYKILSKTFGEEGSSVALKKVAADQLIFAPVFMVIFMIALNGLRGKDWEHIRKELNAKYFDLLINNYKIWPAVQLINFYMIPLNYQILFVQSVALFWNVFVSWKLEQDIKD